MQGRTLGRQGLSVSALGLGCMSLGIADIYSSSVRDEDETEYSLWSRDPEDEIGTSSIERLEENARAVDVRLSAADLAAIEAIAPKGAVSGQRYAAGMMEMVDR